MSSSSIFKKEESPSNGAVKDTSAFQVSKTGGEVDGRSSSSSSSSSSQQSTARAVQLRRGGL
jgi:hypothetical protein